MPTTKAGLNNWNQRSQALQIQKMLETTGIHGITRGRLQVQLNGLQHLQEVFDESPQGGGVGTAM